MERRVLYRDGLILVIDKPAGFAVHRGPKGGSSLEDFFDALRFGLPRPPALAHRLDRDTSGCLVLGRHRKALAHLGLLFKHGRIGKTYWAVVEGGPSADEGRIDLPLGRLDATRGWWMKPDPNGLPAATAWRVLGRSGTDGSARIEAVDRAPHPEPLPGCGETGKRGWTCGGIVGDHPAVHRSDRSLAPRALTWLALTPLTGRTHQIRVHCAAMGCPIVGDAIYGAAPRSGGPALHLHAREVVVPLSRNREPVRVVAPVPEHMRERLAACGWIEDAAQTTAVA